MNKPVLLIDMDEVLVDFYNHPTMPFTTRVKLVSDMTYKEFWTELKPLRGALTAVDKLAKSNMFDIYVCTKPYLCLSNCVSGKVEWISKYLPDLRTKIILTPNKHLMRADILIDDDERNGFGFHGKFIHFKRDRDSAFMWKQILDELLPNKGY